MREALVKSKPCALICVILMSRIVGSTRLTILKAYDRVRDKVFIKFVTHTLPNIAKSKESNSCMIFPKCSSSNTAGIVEVVPAQLATEMHPRQEIKE